MNIEELFQGNIEYSRLHPAFTGEHDNLFEEHGEGHYLLLTSNDKGVAVLRIIFDNGNVYEIEFVRNNVPLYAVATGSPAKAVGFRYTSDGIIDPEKALYLEEGRLPLELLEKNYNKYFIS